MSPRNRIEVKPRSNDRQPATHYIGVVESRGYVYACTWAHEPTVAEVRRAWYLDRCAFRPYDESTGRYL